MGNLLNGLSDPSGLDRSSFLVGGSNDVATADGGSTVGYSCLVDRFCVLDTGVMRLWDTGDHQADGIPHESYAVGARGVFCVDGFLLAKVESGSSFKDGDKFYVASATEICDANHAETGDITCGYVINAAAGVGSGIPSGYIQARFVSPLFVGESVK